MTLRVAVFIKDNERIYRTVDEDGHTIADCWYVQCPICGGLMRKRLIYCDKPNEGGIRSGSLYCFDCKYMDLW